jgi:hypothetical protein
MHELFEFIEPSDKNLECHSYRIHALLTRAAIEVEANLKAILKENRYPKKACDLTMQDYQRLDTSHRLSSYEVKLPMWYGTKGVRRPFSNWSTTHSLNWYQVYNRAKHNRHEHFSSATFEHTIDAMCGLAAVISSQFYKCDFAPVVYWHEPMPNNGFELAIGNYFQIRFPNDWRPEELYDFDWKNIEAEADPFQEISF